MTRAASLLTLFAVLWLAVLYALALDTESRRAEVALNLWTGGIVLAVVQE